MDPVHLHSDDMALLLGAIFHAPASATFPPHPATVARSMGNGGSFRIAAEQVAPPVKRDSPAVTIPNPAAGHTFQVDLPQLVCDGRLVLDHQSTLRRFADACCSAEQAAIVNALMSLGGKKKAEALTKWLIHSPFCPGATGMVCTCGLDEALT